MHPAVASMPTRQTPSQVIKFFFNIASSLALRTPDAAELAGAPVDLGGFDANTVD